MELVPPARDLLLQLGEIVNHPAERCGVGIHQQYRLNRKLFANQFVKKAHASHQSGVGVVSLSLAAKDFLAVVLDGSVFNLEYAVAFAQ